MRRLTDGIDGARLEIIAKCGHLVNLDRPVEFNALLSEFVTA